jgi:alcohol dehydrogenase (cytochrome c)
LLSNENPKQILRALDYRTGNVLWELPQVGTASSWGGTLLFSSGVLFVCADGGSLLAVDSSTGNILWQFETSAALKASPMTYEFDDQQFISVAAGQSILSFGLNQ